MLFYGFNRLIELNLLYKTESDPIFKINYELHVKQTFVFNLNKVKNLHFQ